MATLRGGSAFGSMRSSSSSPSMLASMATLWVPSGELPSEITIIDRWSGKYLRRPASAARMTWPMVFALRNDGMPTRMSIGSYALNSVLVSSLRTGLLIGVLYLPGGLLASSRGFSSVQSGVRYRRPTRLFGLIETGHPRPLIRTMHAGGLVDDHLERTVLGRTPPAVGAVMASGREGSGGPIRTASEHRYSYPVE